MFTDSLPLNYYGYGKLVLPSNKFLDAGICVIKSPCERLDGNQEVVILFRVKRR